MNNFAFSSYLFTTLLITGATSHGAITVLNVSSDTFITERSPNNNAGGHSHVSSGTTGLGQDTRALLEFDLTSISVGSTINSVTLQLGVDRTPAVGSVNSNFSLHRALTNWTEGTGIGNHGSAATSGVTTWNNAMHSTVAWAGDGGQSGVDFVPAFSASTAITGLGSYSWTGGGLVVDVQTMVNTPSSNFGWFLISDQEGTNRTARAFGSREGGNGATLTIDYTLVPEPSSFLLLSLSGLGVTFCRKR